MLEFEAKIWKTGSGSFVVTLPKAFVKNRLLQEGKEYGVIVRETHRESIHATVLNGLIGTDSRNHAII